MSRLNIEIESNKEEIREIQTEINKKESIFRNKKIKNPNETKTTKNRKRYNIS